jgi:hypothetical protein
VSDFDLEALLASKRTTVGAFEPVGDVKDWAHLPQSTFEALIARLRQAEADLKAVDDYRVRMLRDAERIAKLERVRAAAQELSANLVAAGKHRPTKLDAALAALEPTQHA